MSFIDILILVLVIAGAVIGYMKGMVSQISSICGVVLGLVVCNLFGGAATDIFKALVPESANWPAANVTASAIAHIVLFVLVYLSVLLAGGMIRAMVKSLDLGSIDKVGGSVLCAFKYVLCLSILLNLWHFVNPDSDTFTTRHSMGNVPFEMALDLAPFTFGMSEMPSNTLKVDSFDYERVKKDESI